MTTRAMEPYANPSKPVSGPGPAPDPQPAPPLDASRPSDLRSDTPDGAPLDARRRRILFRATHRGTHETDLLIGGFVAPRIAGFDASELDALEELMELPDIDLADWLMGRRPVPSSCDTPMLQAVLAAARARPFTAMGR